MEQDTSKERLLSDYSHDDYQESACHHWLYLRFACVITFALAILCSLAGNLFLLYQNQNLRSKGYGGRSKFAGLLYDTPVVHRTQTEYWGSNETLADQLWNDINIDSLVVALSDKWAVEHDLPISLFRFPWDDGKGLYYLKAFHNLHCLRSLRKAFVNWERGKPREVPSHHIYHCLDALRQDTLCAADDTPMPGTALPDVVGNGQVNMCRNFDALIKWTHEPEREACYRRLNDYPPVKHKIERFAFCPENSRYFDTQQAYFEKWGHWDSSDL